MRELRAAEQHPNPSIPRENASAANRADSPAAVFFQVFRQGTEGVRFPTIADGAGDVARVAAAFGAAELAAAAWLEGTRRWEPELARTFAHALVLCAGNWLLGESGDLAALEHELDSAWQAVRDHT